MGAFKKVLQDDEAYVNGIGRLEAQVESDAEVKWFQSKSRIYTGFSRFFSGLEWTSGHDSGLLNFYHLNQIW